MEKLAQKIELRVQKLETNLELTYSDIFTTVCQETNLNSLALEEVLGCDCPHGLIGFIKELNESEVSDYLNK
ncbi:MULTISPECIES: hypothetical protein [Nostoc]|uniref:Uncharacterized protein n=1 Tax=Nostoc punctiforme FACHB-252 TaxID=1357509 RepID=A0ABR8HK46_NOSPU|nr:MULTISPECIES: hypothetical protein [Nostoc]MBC1237240.1 hypothetical protein [Nostoc sp. 2RC]MBD2615651.1 hypothetical protein [Nostoc punctiforme FACHB-252]